MRISSPVRRTLGELLKGIGRVPAALDTMIYGLSVDSRSVRKGDLFLALSGESTRATDYIREAIERGAVAVAVEGECADGKAYEDGAAVELFVPDLKAHVGEIASRYYGCPSKELRLIGVTGTNGKTSVVNYLGQLMGALGCKTGVIGTLGYGFPDISGEGAFSATSHTTPDAVAMHQYLAVLRQEGAKAAAIEVSSHGLVQGRIDEIEIDCAVLTNVSRDHLDYHGSMEDYVAAKKKLFSRKNLSLAVINLDDEYANEFIEAASGCQRVISYGVAPQADVRVVNSSIGRNGIDATLATPWGQIKLRSSLMGNFNLSNLMAVISVVGGMGLPLEALEQQLEKLHAVNGRMQAVEVAGKPAVIIDYAHTPDALMNVLVSLKPICKGELRVVFGCGGDRDRGKRALMAQAVEQQADRIVVTDDNPRFEDPQQIVTEIMSGFTCKEAVLVVHDRAQAIAQAIGSASVNDIVLIAGKGHENYQEIKGVRRPFSDLEEVQKNLNIWGKDTICTGQEDAHCD